MRNLQVQKQFHIEHPLVSMIHAVPHRILRHRAVVEGFLLEALGRLARRSLVSFCGVTGLLPCEVLPDTGMALRDTGPNV